MQPQLNTTGILFSFIVPSMQLSLQKHLASTIHEYALFLEVQCPQEALSHALYACTHYQQPLFAFSYYCAYRELCTYKRCTDVMWIVKTR